MVNYLTSDVLFYFKDNKIYARSFEKLCLSVAVIFQEVKPEKLILDPLRSIPHFVYFLNVPKNQIK